MDAVGAAAGITMAGGGVGFTETGIMMAGAVGSSTVNAGFATATSSAATEDSAGKVDSAETVEASMAAVAAMGIDNSQEFSGLTLTSKIDTAGSWRMPAVFS